MYSSSASILCATASVSTTHTRLILGGSFRSAFLLSNSLCHINGTYLCADLLVAPTLQPTWSSPGICALYAYWCLFDRHRTLRSCTSRINTSVSHCSRAQTLDIRICCIGLWLPSENIPNPATPRSFYSRTARRSTYVHATKIAYTQVIARRTLAYLERYSSLALEKYTYIFWHTSRSYS